MEKIKIGLVGMGRLGEKHCQNLLYHVPNVELVAVCSIVESEIEKAKQAGIKNVYDDYAAFLQHPGLDAVALATSTNVHVEQINMGLEKGLHVFCEKPLAITVDECQKVIDTAKRHSDKVAMIGFVRRFDKSYMNAKKKIEAGDIGKVFKIFSNTSDWDEFAEFQVKFSQTSGGIFLDYNIHDIDLAHWFMGSKFKSVYCTGCSFAHPAFAEMGSADNTYCLAEMENGAITAISAARTDAHGHGTKTIVTGTSGGLEIGVVPSKDLLVIIDEHGVRQECVKTFFERFEEAFLEELVQFAEAIRLGQPSPISLEDAMEATRVAVAMNESFEKKQVIQIKR